MAAAAELVIEGGLASVTLARVGERAGYSRGIVTHHFGSRQGLLETLARSVQSGFVVGRDDARGLDHLLDLIESYVRGLGSAELTTRAFLVLWAEAATDPELAAIFRERDEAFRADLRVDLEAGVADGRIAADVVPRRAAVAIVGQLRGVGIQRLLDPTAVDTDALARDLRVHWGRVLGA